MRKVFLTGLLFVTACSSGMRALTSDDVATVNQNAITKEDFATQLQSLQGIPGSNLATEDGRLGVLKDMVQEELVFQEALKADFVQKNLNIKHDIVKEYLREKFGQHLPQISDDQVKKYYTQNEQKINQVRASHILIKPKDIKDAASKQEAMEKLQSIREDILHNKIKFEDAAKKYSEDDGTKEKGGDLNFFNRSQMTAPFSKAAFELKSIGDISPIVETEFGYHIIKLTGDQRGFDVVKERIRWKLYQDAIQPEINDYFAKLKETAKIQINQKDLMSINLPAQ